MTTPILGQPAPDFELSSTENSSIRLSNLRGHCVVLYFYPKDNTPGCTQEAQDFRNHAIEFQRLNTIVLGISRDNLASHVQFKLKQSLPFALLSDENSEVCHAYDVIRLKNIFGKKTEGIERSTFIIDRQGILAREWRKVKVDGHINAVLKTLRDGI